MKKQWWKEAVVYQIYPRSFKDTNNDGIGDLKGITEKLDYLKNLGVDVLWLCPIYASPNDDNGYDISDYYSIMKDFGTMADFDELLETAHQKGLKIILDLVANHTSDEHQWFIESRKSLDNPYRDYYFWRNQPNNWGSFFSGSAWEKDETTNTYYLHIFSKKQPDLNWDNPRVREDIYKMMRWWLDKGIDGFRMDVLCLISKVPGLPDGVVREGALHGDLWPYCADGPRVHEYIQEMYDKVLSHYDLMTVGETPGTPSEKALDYVHEDRHELQMLFSFDHVSLDSGPYGKWTTRKTNLVDLKKTLNKWQHDLEQGGWNSLYWDNHDQPRAVSRFGDDRPAYRVKSAKMLAACLHMMKGTPYIYQGEELGMTNVAFDHIEDYRDVETLNAYRELVTENHLLSHDEMMDGIHAKGRDNARTPMQWDDSPYGGFSNVTPWINVNPNYTTINAKSQVNDPDSVYHFYQELIRLRKTHDIIVYGDYIPVLEDDPDLFAYQRALNDETLYVFCNFSDHDVFIDLPVNDQLLITNDPVIDAHKLSAYQAVVYLHKP